MIGTGGRGSPRLPQAITTRAAHARNFFTGADSNGRGTNAMCGIIGYVGTREVVPVLLGGLKKLEYRGYDSAGVAVVNGNGPGSAVSVVRAEGKLSNLEGKLVDHELHGTFGMGHTRWATHGKPNENNAHPHRDCTGNVVVIHNGIIENFLPLKQRLKSQGHEFKSETDTEVVAHLIEEYRKDRSEEHTSELQSPCNLVCRLLLE